MKGSRWLAMMAGCVSVASAQQRTPPGERARASDTLQVSRRQAIVTALLANPQLEIARQQTLQVRAQRVEGNAIPDPSFSLSYDSLSGPVRLRSASSQSASVGVSIPFPDKFRLRHQIGSANLRASEAQFQLFKQQVEAAAGRAYDSVVVTRVQRRNLQQARDYATEFLKRAQARFDAGLVPRLDVIKAQVDVAQSENDLIASARDVANAEAALNRVMGRPLGAALVATDSLAATDPLPDLDLVERTALRLRPEIAAVLAQQHSAHANSTLTKENAILPDFFIGANRDLMTSDGAWYSAGFSMPIPVFFWQHTHGDFAEVRHRELELAATLIDTRAAVGQDVRSAYATADAARRQVVFIRDQLLPSAQEAFRVANLSYQLGGSSALEVLDARRAMLDAQRQYTVALAAASSARSDLERATAAPLATLVPGVAK
jgi:cobalt-zinc-cadmium efflux system outer membrane protein